MNESPVPPTPLLQASHARYLEQISDQEFWHHAAKLATTPSGVQPDTGGYMACPCPYHLDYNHASEQADELRPDKVLVPLTHLREIIAAPPRFTYLPASPHWMIGITAWHRDPIAVIDLAAYLTQTQQQSQIQTDSSILIAQHEAITLGFSTSITDIVAEFPPEHIQPFDKRMMQSQHHGTDAIIGTYANAFILHLPTILTAIVQELRTAPL